MLIEVTGLSEAIDYLTQIPLQVNRASKPQTEKIQTVSSLINLSSLSPEQNQQWINEALKLD